ncbi:TPM domain-containing protein [uncultured Kushneria sp.]|uniref:TPM domain-containing protein n=1 Tax=uncultured Kushneria sp. TaxID=905033 RepID=UPI00262D0673|nr:TPM domain-containing protein [uncultured Kushneria sp.]
MRQLTRSLTLGVVLLLCTAAAQAAPDFPELTGRVVDNAELLDTDTETKLSQTLAAHEEATGEQVVVVTLPDLGGEPIEQYGYQLGRAWGIGQEGEDNGALLIVALDERQVRIEVGYGLEGRLTDAQSSAIINQVITPAFRDGDYARGIVEGSQAMIQVLGGDPLAQASQRPERGANESRELGGAGIWLTILMFIVLMIVRGGGGRGGRGGLLGGMLLGGALGGGGRSGGGLGGGGFSGGGGFGGGGASGGW